MKIAALGALAMLILAGAPAEANEIDTRAKFFVEVVGRKLVMDGSWMKIEADGTVEGIGEPGKEKINGSWRWKGKHYCRELTIGPVPFPEDCQVVKRNIDSVTFVHKKGKGVSVTWTIE